MHCLLQHWKSRVLAKLGETPFELLKNEQEEGTVENVIVEKKVSVLNESLINFLKQGITLGHGVGFSSVIIASICQICGFGDHVASICLRIGDLKPKCGKCGLPHKTKNCGLQCGYYNHMGHAKEWCWKKRKEPKPNFVANNYLEALIDDEATTLE
jgi:hypothetical protein